MTDDRLDAIEAYVRRAMAGAVERQEWAKDGMLDVTTLVAEVRRLKAALGEATAATLTWIPPDIARNAVVSGQDAVVDKLARALEARRMRDAAEFIRIAWREAKR